MSPKSSSPPDPPCTKLFIAILLVTSAVAAVFYAGEYDKERRVFTQFRTDSDCRASNVVGSTTLFFPGKSPAHVDLLDVPAEITPNNIDEYFQNCQLFNRFFQARSDNGNPRNQELRFIRCDKVSTFEMIFYYSSSSTTCTIPAPPTQYCVWYYNSLLFRHMLPCCEATLALGNVNDYEVAALDRIKQAIIAKLAPFDCELQTFERSNAVFVSVMAITTGMNFLLFTLAQKLLMLFQKRDPKDGGDDDDEEDEAASMETSSKQSIRLKKSTTSSKV